MTSQKQTVETKVFPLGGAVAIVFHHSADPRVSPDRVKILDAPFSRGGEMHDVDHEPNIDNCFLPQSVDMRGNDGKTEAFVWRLNDGRSTTNHTSETAAADVNAALDAEQRQKNRCWLPAFMR